MQTFSALLDRLAFTPSRNGKLRLMQNYLEQTPDPDRGWALAVLTDGLDIKLSFRKLIAGLLDGRVDPVLFSLSREYVGDSAETVALLWPESADETESPILRDVVDALRVATPADMEQLLVGWLGALDASGRWALLKLLTGGLRIGVSARLAKTAVAALGGKKVSEIEEVWHGVTAPYGDLFAWLEGRAEKPDLSHRAVFRPLMLAHPLDEPDLQRLQAGDYSAEWKWDGIRVQVSALGSEVRLYSRAGDDISAAFPELSGAAWGDVVLDGELLVVRDGEVAPFNDLQQRLNRKTVSKKMLADYPAFIRLYDILVLAERDLRDKPFHARRAELEAWSAAAKPSHADLSELVEFTSIEGLRSLWLETRQNGIEGLMLKRRDSPYLVGRPKGHWFKWKRAPLTLDTVLMYAQRGSGKRSSYYSDYTFGAWRDGKDGGRELVPVGKAYFGFTDDELVQLDKWVRNHTTERFGPVRAVEPDLVVEVAFDAAHLSGRHKSGVAMRFPRIHRVRWDKPASQADTVQSLIDLIDG
jgi:DNA ligase-1